MRKCDCCKNENIALKISLSLNKNKEVRYLLMKPTSTQGVLAIGYKIVKEP
jgi:hypothetical protein